MTWEAARERNRAVNHGLNPEFPDGQPTPSGWRAFQAAVIFAIVFGTVLALTGAFCFYLPRGYYSRVIMQVRAAPPLEDWNCLAPSAPNLLDAPGFQIIQSKEVLYPVIDNLRLVETWGVSSKEEAYTRLLPKLKIAPVRDTILIEIGVFSIDRQEAANIANTIAVIYQKVRREDAAELRNAALGPLRDEVAAQRKKVEAKRIEMQNIREREQILDPNPEEFDGSQAVGQSQDYINLKSDYLKAKRMLEEAERRLSTQFREFCSWDVPKIWEKAEPAVYPAKPYVGRILSLGVAAGAVLGASATALFLRSTRRR